jgi:hypothetical protein
LKAKKAPARSEAKPAELEATPEDKGKLAEEGTKEKDRSRLALRGTLQGTAERKTNDIIGEEKPDVLLRAPSPLAGAPPPPAQAASKAAHGSRLASKTGARDGRQELGPGGDDEEGVEGGVEGGVVGGALGGFAGRASEPQDAREQAATEKSSRTLYATPPAKKERLDSSESLAREVTSVREALNRGAVGLERAGLLNRLCELLFALGQEGDANAACDAVLKEFPDTQAAQAVRTLKARRNVSPAGSPKAPTRPGAEKRAP